LRKDQTLPNQGLLQNSLSHVRQSLRLCRMSEGELPDIFDCIGRDMERYVLPSPWHHIRHLGKSKAVNSSYVWIFLLPTITKLYEFFARAYPTVDQEYLRLPFSWQLLFLSALLFSIGLAIYHLRCPTLIKEFSSFGDYKAKGGTFLDLLERWEDYIREDRGPFDSVDNMIQNFYYWSVGTYPREIKEGSGFPGDCWRAEMKDMPEPSNSRFGKAFSEVYATLDRRHPRSRLASSVFFLLGFMTIGVVLIQNIASVLTYSVQTF